MKPLLRTDLLSLQQYSEQRLQFRRQVMAHKKNRVIYLGEHLGLYFEDRLTMQYQVQEMLRVEKIFEDAAIEEELATYNPLIPDGHNLKATLMIEYTDVAERQQMLTHLVGIETRVWMRVAEFEKVWPIADEDLERADATKTSAVHFLRYEFSEAMIAAAQAGGTLSSGAEHPAYHSEVIVAPEVTQALIADFTMDTSGTRNPG
ncbi:MAG TPA: DUF3501 family protein [Gammaproteobacteria bacterium]|nr:DUF3501 family protein [Gammaproteobacteria bacterium]